VTEADTVDTASVATKVEQGTYFAEAKKWYTLLYHMPIAERSFYIIIIAMGVLTAFICIRAFISIFPIAPSVPFVTMTYDVINDVPSMRRIRSSLDEDRNQAILRYYLTDYITRRESYAYDPSMLERNFYNIRSASTPDVFKAYRAWYDASNPASPFNLYGSQATRKIAIARMNVSNGHANVIFTETVTTVSGTTARQWVADIVFKYTPYSVEQDIEELSMFNFFGIALDVYQHPEKYRQKGSFNITPMTFMVTAYSSNPYIVSE
jgi:type IV secretory pathway component VirB8